MDFRYALRTLAKNPGFTAVVLLTLALGIGGSTSIFSLVYGVLLRPLPYLEAERIVAVHSMRTGAAGNQAHTPGDFLDIRRDNRSLAHLAGYRGDVVDIAADGSAPMRLDGALVTPSFFDVFGVRAAVGHAPFTYAAVLALLGAVVFAACSIPALRAARVNPMSALRADQP